MFVHNNAARSTKIFRLSENLSRRNFSDVSAAFSHPYTYTLRVLYPFRCSRRSLFGTRGAVVLECFAALLPSRSNYSTRSEHTAYIFRKRNLSCIGARKYVRENVLERKSSTLIIHYTHLIRASRLAARLQRVTNGDVAGVETPGRDKRFGFVFDKCVRLNFQSDV